MLTQVLRSVCAATLLVGGMEVAALAQTVDQRTTFRFSGPVSLPGVTLPAGEYIFRIANPDTQRDVVQVLSADGRETYAMFHTLPAERNEPTPDPTVSFHETAADLAPAMAAWWTPDETTGREFFYAPQKIEPMKTARAASSDAQVAEVLALLSEPYKGPGYEGAVEAPGFVADGDTNDVEMVLALLSEPFKEPGFEGFPEGDPLIAQETIDVAALTGIAEAPLTEQATPIDGSVAAVHVDDLDIG
jgi:hypothetical protein